MTNGKLFGIIIPPIIPFTEGGAFDWDALKELVEFWCEKVDGFFIGGTVSLGPLMTFEERKELVERFIKYVDGRLPVIVHVGAPSTLVAVELAKHAEALGASAIGAVPPYYYQHTVDAIKRYYEEIVSSVSVPVYIYNIPRNTGVSIGLEVLRDLASLGVKGIKDSTFDFAYHMELRRKMDTQNFDVVQGTDALMVPSWMIGTRSCVSGLANCVPEFVKSIFNKCEEGCYEEAFTMQQVLLRVRDTIGQASFIPMLYSMLRLRGLKGGYPRAPFSMPSIEMVSRVKQILVEIGAL